jgi:F-type H+-transporting ATPase subunit epsilon
MATLKLEIITPTATIFSGDVDIVHLPGAEGEMDILPSHEAMVTELIAGELVITHKGKTEVLAIGEGFAEVTGTSVGVLTDGAIHEKDIDEKIAEEAVKRAEELLKSSTLAGEELEATQASLARSLAQIRVKRRHHN